MKRNTLFLKVIVILIGIPVLALCIFFVPGFVNYLHYSILIGVYAITIGILYALIAPFLIPTADADDAPGLVGIPLIIILASSVIAVFAAVLQKLLKEAIDIKAENDLTI